MFRRGGAGKRRDTNEPAILQALRAYGAECWQVSGRGLPDVLAHYRGRWYPMEIKTARGTLTAAQGDVRWPVVRSEAEALAAIGIQAV